MGFIDRMSKDENEDRKIKMDSSRLPVRNMLKKGLPLDLVAELLNVDIEIVKALSEELENEK
ncbi:hypothetical protein ACED96_06705 [Clostridium thermobutyricum]|uniref:Uncharacterized protein n=2 Tax=Clostridium thermobutyricum TaxID=29372 RepID=N9WDZ1_9CLOT|nr:hypothetical protein [Clostridium thermobutyricum]ENZ01246.1 hypothetical protein HMPREF1092_01954 [Clostridium thermobutyricum]OPX47140.1 hypothetical protein CLTHE_21790 [Clostridium thermobutyricum DSM 4928]